MFIAPILSYILFVVMLLGGTLLAPFGFAFALRQMLLVKGPVNKLLYLSAGFRALAVAGDVLLNTLLGPMLNLFMLVSTSSHHFGSSIHETMSAVYGHNKQAATLSAMGRFVADYLNWLEPGHVELAADLPITVDAFSLARRIGFVLFTALLLILLLGWTFLLGRHFMY